MCLALLGLGLLSGAAHGSVITAANVGTLPNVPVWSYTVTMPGPTEVSTLTIEAMPGAAGRFRISEAGAALTFTVPAGENPCLQVSAGVFNCVAPVNSAISVLNQGGSAVPPNRDRVIVRGAAHGDAASTRAPIAVNVTSPGGLMEFWSSDIGSKFTGSSFPVGTPSVPADIWHSGRADTCSPLGGVPIAETTCKLGAGADRYEGGGGSVWVDGGDGNDTMLGGTGNETISGGNQDDHVQPGGGKDVVSGNAGTDTLAFNEPARQTGLTATFANNTPGSTGTAPYDTSVLGTVAGFGDAWDNSFERLFGTPVADTLTGGPSIDRIAGAGGDDVIRGGGGADGLDGGDGFDTVDYRDRSAASPVNVSFAAGTGGSPGVDGSGDLLVAFERVLGTPGADTLTGGGADESFEGAGGADRVTGGGGTDTVSYEDRSEGVSVTVGGGADDGNSADGPPGARDDLQQIENVEGTPFGDTLVGDDASGTLTGGPGDDTLDGGGGADRLDGGEGRDTASYATRGSGADVSLAAGTGPDGDSLASIENLRGGPGDDRLTGDDNGNRIDGAGGNDTITGLGGIDEFFGGDGDDSVFARDGLRESVECGSGRNKAEVDDSDLTRDCAFDADGDGAPDDADCAPNDRSRRPGIGEIRGNDIDENCDGHAEAFPTVGANTILSWSLLRNGRTKLRALRVERLLPGDQVSISCKGTGCKKSATRKPITVKKGPSTSFTKHVKNMSLAPKATLEVRVTRAGATGRVAVYTFLRRKDPEKQQRCLPPGEKKPQRC